MPRPNIVVILADDMGYGDFSCFNDGALVDARPRPARRRRAPASPSTTRPRRCARRPGPRSSPAATRTAPAPSTPSRAGASTASRSTSARSPTCFAAAGYATGLVGKWHNGALDDRYHPNRRGFDEFAGFRGGWSDYWHWFMDRNGSRASRATAATSPTCSPTRPSPSSRRHRQRAVLPRTSPTARRTSRCRRPTTTWPRSSRPGGSPARSAASTGCCASMDRGIGRVLDELDRLGLADEHARAVLERQRPAVHRRGRRLAATASTAASAAPSFSSTRAASASRRCCAGPTACPAAAARWTTSCTSPTGCPTLLAAAGIDLPRRPRARRRRRAPAPAGRVRADVRRPLLAVEPLRARRHVQRGHARRRWKLVRPAIYELMRVSNEDFGMDVESKFRPENYSELITTPLPAPEPYAVPAPKLYNLRGDPLEQHDLAADHPERATSMQSALAAWFEEVEADRRRHE